MANNGRNGTGRIYPHNRDANFSGAILGDSIVLDNIYVEGIQETEKFSIDVNTLDDPTKYFWKNNHDLVYDGLNTKFVKAFLSTKVVKENGDEEE